MRAYTKVVNKYTTHYDVDITRNGPWGNPFKIGVSGKRSEVIRKYEKYLLRHPELIANLYTLVGRRLGCVCKPQACHGDVIVKLIKKFGLEDA
jgi:hypothetical protein